MSFLICDTLPSVGFPVVLVDFSALTVILFHVRVSSVVLVNIVMFYSVALCKFRVNFGCNLRWNDEVISVAIIPAAKWFFDGIIIV